MSFVSLICGDGVRPEKARKALSKLVAAGALHPDENVRLFVKCSNFKPLVQALVVTSDRLLAVDAAGTRVKFAVDLAELGQIEPDEKRGKLKVSSPQGSPTFKLIPPEDIPALVDHLTVGPQPSDSEQRNEPGNPPPSSPNDPPAAAAPSLPPLGPLASGTSPAAFSAPGIPRQDAPPAPAGTPTRREQDRDRASLEAAAARSFRAVLTAFPDAAGRTTDPSRPSGPAVNYWLPGDGRQRVVGEHYYQPAFRVICRGRKVPRAGDEDCWEDSAVVTARLVAERDNPHDRNAVRVDVQGKPVGYLPREDAPVLQAILAEIEEEGKIAGCEGRIVIAGDGEYAMLSMAVRKYPQVDGLQSPVLAS